MRQSKNTEEYKILKNTQWKEPLKNVRTHFPRHTQKKRLQMKTKVSENGKKVKEDKIK